MADRNLNNFETTLQASLTDSAASLVLTNAAANRLHAEAFSASKTVRLTIRSGNTREVVQVSARTVDTPSAGLATVTIDERGLEAVSAASPAGQNFPSGAFVYAAMTAGQIEALRAGGGGGGGSSAIVHVLDDTGGVIELSGDDWILAQLGNSSPEIEIVIPDDPDNAGAALEAVYRVHIHMQGGAPGQTLDITLRHDTTDEYISGDTGPFAAAGWDPESWTFQIIVEDSVDGVAYVSLIDNHVI